MNKQKLFIIVVIVILVLSVSYTGIVMFKSYSETSIRDQTISTLYDIGMNAQNYFKKNHDQTGNNSFLGWRLPDYYKNTEAATFSAVVQFDRVNLCASGKQTGINGFSQSRITARVDNNEIRITVIN